MFHFRKYFEKNYTAVKEPCGNRKGFKIVYHYCGPWYFWKIEHMERCKGMLLAAGLLNAAAYVMASIQYAEINMVPCFFVPAVLALIPLMFEEIGILQFCWHRGKLTEYDFFDIRKKLTIAPVFHVAVMAAAIGAGLYYLAAASFSLKSLAVVLVYLFCAGTSLVVFRMARGLSYYSEDNPMRIEIEKMNMQEM